MKVQWFNTFNNFRNRLSF